ncbi:MAG: hypothetical protein KDE56_18040 [Anaerolineales bacterium]|nr:hypothetical protein [Anaerolineales bacterium]
MKHIFWVMVVVVMVLVGCSAGETAVREPDIASVATVAATRAPALRAVTAVPPVSEETTPELTSGQADPERMKKLEAELGDAVILYQKSGGFAGVTESWWVYANGRLRDKDGNEWQLPAKEVETFLANSKKLGLTQMQPTYVPDGFCCDQFVYSLIVRHDDGIYQTATADGVDAPQELFQLIDEVSMLVAERNTN